MNRSMFEYMSWNEKNAPSGRTIATPSAAAPQGGVKDIEKVATGDDLPVQQAAFF